MKTITLTAQTLTGEAVAITATTTAIHKETGVPIVDLPQMDDAQWEALAKKLNKEKALA